MSKWKEIIRYALGIIIFGLGIFFYNYSREIIDNENKESSLPIPIAEGYDWDGTLPQNNGDANLQEMILFPGYGDMEFTKNDATLALINPTGNTVYMQYQIVKADTILFESDLILSGKMIITDMREYLGIGVHKVTIKLFTYDLYQFDYETNSFIPCTPTEFPVQITIK